MDLAFLEAFSRRINLRVFLDRNGLGTGTFRRPPPGQGGGKSPALTGGLAAVVPADGDATFGAEPKMVSMGDVHLGLS